MVFNGKYGQVRLVGDLNGCANVGFPKFHHPISIVSASHFSSARRLRSHSFFLPEQPQLGRINKNFLQLAIGKSGVFLFLLFVAVSGNLFRDNGRAAPQPTPAFERSCFARGSERNHPSIKTLLQLFQPTNRSATANYPLNPRETHDQQQFHHGYALETRPLVTTSGLPNRLAPLPSRPRHRMPPPRRLLSCNRGLGWRRRRCNEGSRSPGAGGPGFCGGGKPGGVLPKFSVQDRPRHQESGRRVALADGRAAEEEKKKPGMRGWFRRRSRSFVFLFVAWSGRALRWAGRVALPFFFGGMTSIRGPCSFFLFFTGWIFRKGSAPFAGFMLGHKILFSLYFLPWCFSQFLV
ncbi:uncharacterized protein TM35_000361100 [Trypanosoma theileri]|uniref:Uncharacterized protein n=1 Tax=Trypanosoma theileri TaxID=67003 RepID=A0A1X0NM93_9TRYP|nr:uncharacterized protein TM35_000361100 [Trypanosoma theileri]ORC85250.1 hypothetical protein TM35_000361100 [Trypanosoma theileri]